MQEYIIIALFAGALVYLGFILRNAFRTDTGCGKNCGCDSTSVNKYIKSS